MKRIVILSFAALLTLGHVACTKKEEAPTPPPSAPAPEVQNAPQGGGAPAPGGAPQGGTAPMDQKAPADAAPQGAPGGDAAKAPH